MSENTGSRGRVQVVRKRKYQTVWEKIKLNGHITLEVAPIFVARVKKAVIKEKDMDLGFKLMNEHDIFRLNSFYDKTKMQLKFVLKQRAGIEERILV